MLCSSSLPLYSPLGVESSEAPAVALRAENIFLAVIIFQQCKILVVASLLLVLLNGPTWHHVYTTCKLQYCMIGWLDLWQSNATSPARRPKSEAAIATALVRHNLILAARLLVSPTCKKSASTCLSLVSQCHRESFDCCAPDYFAKNGAYATLKKAKLI
jgi:hypothetical protein